MTSKKLSLDEGKKAVKLARKSIESEFKTIKKDIDLPEIFEQKRGVFVTIKEKNSLRGCIGRPYPNQDLKNGIIGASKDSALKDPRFPPLKENELKNIVIELTILTEPEKIETEPKKRKEEIKIGKHGLITEYGPNKGLLLPQVPVDNGWDEEQFLSKTCMKAGLTGDCWLEEDVEFYKFSGQIFAEKNPLGEIVERKINESS